MGFSDIVRGITGDSAPMVREAPELPSGGWPTVAGVDSDEHLWRSLSGINPRDLTSWDQSRMIEVCYFLARTNPMAKRIVNTIAEFVWGAGPVITALDPAVDEILQEFWKDPVSAWPVKGPKKVRDLSIYGELALRPYSNMAGRVRTCYIPPSHIKAAVTDPNNPDLLDGIVLYKNPAEAGGGGPPATGPTEGGYGPDELLKQLHREENSNDGQFGYWTGDVLYIPINNTSDGKRGISDLYDLADWIDLYDQFLFGRTEKVAHMNQWFWDVTIQGADQKKIESWLKDQMNNTPRPGAIRAHNESVVWAPMVPSLAADDAHTDADGIKSHILSGSGLPPTWFPGGEGTRAAAVEMAEPTMRALTSRQSLVRYYLELLLKYALQEYMRANPEITRRIKSTSFLVEMDAVSTRDLYRSGTAVQRVGQIIIQAFQAGLVDQSTAMRQYRSTLDMLGLGYENLQQLETAADDTRIEMFPGENAASLEKMPGLPKTETFETLRESNRAEVVTMIHEASQRRKARLRARAQTWLSNGRVVL